MAPSSFVPTPSGLRRPLLTGMVWPSGVIFSAQPRNSSFEL
jgi:hypothetical protein